LLRRFGQKSTEAQIARECFISRSGTEAWYLARMFRKRGLNVHFAFQPDPGQPWPVPAIAGVRLPQSGNTGHFITVLDYRGDKYVIGDPLDGMTTQSQSELHDAYNFTGFFLAVR
jgi:ABC-type bacteriocin/lantibiotic exporter with double-glycine peptidase domain